MLKRFIQLLGGVYEIIRTWKQHYEENECSKEGFSSTEWGKPHLHTHFNSA